MYPSMYSKGSAWALSVPMAQGKSTLLRLISGNLTATSGAIDVRGKISAMLSLTSFLNPDQTGIENIRFNMIVNGARPRDIPELTEEIVEFTELGAFIRAPVRTYRLRDECASGVRDLDRYQTRRAPCR